MENLRQEYINLISSLSEDHFKLYIQKYLKLYWNTEEVNISDGPWDGGIDAVVYRNKEQQAIKRNIQITVQDNFEHKLYKDIEKSEKNVRKWNYLNNLDFYISKPISQSKKDEYIHLSEIDHNIILKIYDANKLADDIEKYSDLKGYLHGIFAPTVLPKPVGINKTNKILYDMFSTGGDIANIKYDFINSYIQYCLLEKGLSSLDEIANYVNSQLGNTLSNRAIKSQIDSQIHLKIIGINEELHYYLEEDSLCKFKEIQAVSTSLERNLILGLENCLDKYSLKHITSDVIDKTIELYNAHYESEIEELNTTNKAFEIKERKVFSDLVRFIEKKGSNGNAAEIVKEILEISSKSEYLNKISITTLFASLFKSNSLDKYLDQFNKNVYLDTQVLLQLICVKYKSTEYRDDLYNSVKYLLQQKDALMGKICFHTTSDYVEEAASHLWEANQIKRLLALPYIKQLGPSKNVFFNFYLFLQESGRDHFENFDEFISDLSGLELDSIPNKKEDFIPEIVSCLSELLENVDIEIHNMPYFDNYSSYMRDYEIQLSNINKDAKSKRARENDLKCILYLSDESNHIDENTKLFDEPFFITWDSSFYHFRKYFIQKYKFSYWYIYTPIKFANRLSVMSFKLDSKHLNYDIISLAETNFKLSNEFTSFIDTLSSLFNKDKITDWKLGIKIANMKKQQKEDVSLHDFSEKNNNMQPVDEVLRSIVNYYEKPDVKIKLSEITALFENNNYTDAISSLIEESCKYLIINNKINNKIYAELSGLISRKI